MVVCWWKRISYYSLIQTSLIPRPSLPCNNFTCDQRPYVQLVRGRREGLGTRLILTPLGEKKVS